MLDNVETSSVLNVTSKFMLSINDKHRAVEESRCKEVQAAMLSPVTKTIPVILYFMSDNLYISRAERQNIFNKCSSLVNRPN